MYNSVHHNLESHEKYIEKGWRVNKNANNLVQWYLYTPTPPKGVKSKKSWDTTPPTLCNVFCF